MKRIYESSHFLKTIYFSRRSFLVFFLFTFPFFKYKDNKANVFFYKKKKTDKIVWKWSREIRRNIFYLLEKNNKLGVVSGLHVL